MTTEPPTLIEQLRYECTELAGKHCISAAGCADWSVGACLAFKLACHRLQLALAYSDQLASALAAFLKDGCDLAECERTASQLLLRKE